MIKTLIIDPSLENEFIEMMRMMDFEKADRYVSGGQMSAIVVAITFEGDERKLHNNFYFNRGNQYYSLDYLCGTYANNDAKFFEFVSEIQRQEPWQIKTIPNSLNI